MRSGSAVRFVDLILEIRRDVLAAVAHCRRMNSGPDEDAVSFASNALLGLMEKHDIDYSQIGRLEVGTESMVDRSKSIKTSDKPDTISLCSSDSCSSDSCSSSCRSHSPAHPSLYPPAIQFRLHSPATVLADSHIRYLMQHFSAHGNHNVEGVDTYNACYGGTAAVLNSIAWLRSRPPSDKRLAIVIAVDIADLREEQQFLNGAAAVAILLGADAPLVLEPLRGSHMIHTTDFYKPTGWADPYPLMRDGAHSIECYMECLAQCLQRIEEGKGSPGWVVNNVDYFVNHCTSTYLCKRAFMKTLELHEASVGKKLGLKQRAELYEAKGAAVRPLQLCLCVVVVVTVLVSLSSRLLKC